MEEQFMHHFIYKTISSSGKYYIGRHSTSNLDDGYMGSGKWVRSISDKSSLTRVILEEFSSFEDLLIAEKEYIARCIDDPLNMNFNDSSVGFGTGAHNPSQLEHVKSMASKRAKENNPMKNGHTTEAKEKISSFMRSHNPFKGKRHSDETKKKISESRSGSEWTDEQKKALAIVRRKEYYEIRKDKLTFNKPHSDCTKQKMSIAHRNRPKQTCVHCGKVVAINILNRWHNDNCKSKS